MVMINAADWKVGSPIYYYMALGNDAYNVHNAGSGYRFDLNATYALTSLDNNKIRFEVRPGDNNWFDGEGGSERSEIESRDYIQNGVPLDISYKFTLDAGAPNKARFFLIGQLQEEAVTTEPGRAPVCSVELVGEKMRVVVRSGGPREEKINVVYQDKLDIQRGHEYDIQIKALVDPSGQSRLVVLRDGEAIVDFAGKMGYTDRVSLHWKQGIYRSPSQEVVSATYSDLKISHGDMVTIPPKGSATAKPAAAPTIAHREDEGGVSGGQAWTVLTGKAAAGTLVKIYDGEKAVAEGRAGSDGTYSVTVSGLKPGSHVFTATSTDASGALSKLSSQVVVEVGTQAEILGRMDYVGAKADLAAIYLTGTNVITVSSVAQMKTLLSEHKDVLETIKGGYSFDFWSGLPTYRTHWSYDANGKLVLSETNLVTDGVLTRKTVEHFDGSGIAKETYQYAIAGKPYASTYQGFDGAGKLVLSVRYHTDGTLEYVGRNLPDGTSLTQTYDMAGRIVGRTINKADGSAFNEKYDASGTVVLRSDQVAGVTVTKTFDAQGQTLTSIVQNPDKSSVFTTFIGGKIASQTLTHAPNDPSGIGREVFIFQVKNATFESSYTVYSSANKLLDSVTKRADGTLDSSFHLEANGTTRTEKYDAKGQLASQSFAFADKTADLRTFVDGVLKRETITLPTGDANRAKLVYDFNIDGQAYGSKLTVYNIYNKVVSVQTFTTDVVDTPVTAAIKGMPGPVSVPQPEEAPILKPLPALDNGQVGSDAPEPVPQPDPTPVPQPDPTPAPPPVGQPLPVLAPVLELKTATAGDGAIAATLAGAAGAGSTVKIFDSGTLVGTVMADAGGKFTLQLVGLAGGRHSLVAVATEADGRASAPSGEVALAVLTAAEFSKTLASLSSLPALKAICIADTTVIPIAAGERPTALLDKYAKVFAMVKGDYSFESLSVTSAAKVQSTYTKAGALIETHTTGYKGGVMVSETIVYAQPGAPYAREVFQHNIAGQPYTSSYAAYDAAGNAVLMTRSYKDGSLCFRSVRDADATVTNESWSATGVPTAFSRTGKDGSSLIKSFEPDGKIKSVFSKAADGSTETEFYEKGLLSTEILAFKPGSRAGIDPAVAKEVFTFNVKGQDYVSAHSTFDAAGKTLEIERFHADNSLAFSFKLEAGGRTVTSSFDADGDILQRIVVDPAKGAKDVFNFNMPGKSYHTEHLTYSSANRVVLAEYENLDGSRDVVLKAAKLKVGSTSADETFTSFQAETFVFKDDFGDDRIVKFNAGRGTLHDTIVLERGMVAKDDALAAAKQVESDVVITTLDHDTITLVGIQKAQLHAVDFLVV